MFNQGGEERERGGDYKHFPRRPDNDTLRYVGLFKLSNETLDVI